MAENLIVPNSSQYNAQAKLLQGVFAKLVGDKLAKGCDAAAHIDAAHYYSGFYPKAEISGKLSISITRMAELLRLGDQTVERMLASITAINEAVGWKLHSWRSGGQSKVHDEDGEVRQWTFASEYLCPSPYRILLNRVHVRIHALVYQKEILPFDHKSHFQIAAAIVEDTIGSGRYKKLQSTIQPPPAKCPEAKEQRKKDRQADKVNRMKVEERPDYFKKQFADFIEVYRLATTYGYEPDEEFWKALGRER